QDYFYRRLERFVKHENISKVKFVGYVPDHELDIVFQNAQCFAFPSLYEGFGLPPLEAMAKGTPVISSDHDCMREILGNSAHFFDAKNSEDICRAIKEITNNKKLREELIKKGYQQIEKYSWRRMARETQKIYESV
ncbi:MAG TPA: glycosyltransferase family 1 protein, partial [Patescibacteria group bacterium]|nr:glycosyltransferase family 1 protein [Patescibacteria group bacterium]